MGAMVVGVAADDMTRIDYVGPRVRPAVAADLRHLAPIEDSTDPLFREYFGADIHPVLLSPAEDGRHRAAMPGFILVAGRPPVGFAHVLDIEGHAHLEELAVHLDHQRQGIGAELTRAAMGEARSRGYDRISLCTYRDVPWNGPFYRALGFTEVADLAPYEQRLRATERDLGLDVNGVRVVMSIALR
jgi:ribosomal protein S18 acetylase RimI-like enzyme